MSLTSYQAAPPRVVSISIETTKIKSKMRFKTTITRSARMAPAVGFGASFPLFQRDLSAFYLGNQSNSATTRTDSSTAVCWQICWHLLPSIHAVKHHYGRTAARIKSDAMVKKE